jgi:putative Holliday junction resolvase
MRYLAIDLGTKRIGVAIGDDESRIASPLQVIEGKSPDAAIGLIAKLIKSEGVDCIVIGLPLNMDGTLGPAVKHVIQWSKKLTAETGSDPIFVDERLSSFAAEGQLNDRQRAGERLTRRKKKQRLDALAAAGFLQAFLEGKLPQTIVSSAKIAQQ